MDHLKPKREYTDWHRLAPRKFIYRHYGGENDWKYFYNIDWESFLLYIVILDNKGYKLEKMPHWLSVYLKEMKVVPFETNSEDITLTFHRKGWVKNTLTFHLKDKTAPNGFVYNVKSKIEAEENFLNGESGPSCPQSVWEPYAVRRLENLREGNLWEPK